MEQQFLRILFNKANNRVSIARYPDRIRRNAAALMKKNVHFYDSYVL